MGESVLVLVGTRKGLFILRSDDDRRSWSLKGPLCETWPINHAVAETYLRLIKARRGDAST